MTIANCLINHTAHVYTNLVPHEENSERAASGMSAAEKRFFDGLGSRFTTSEAKALATTCGLPWKTAERYLGKFVSRYHAARRISQGTYQKVSQQA